MLKFKFVFSVLYIVCIFVAQIDLYKLKNAEMNSRKKHFSEAFPVSRNMFSRWRRAVSILKTNRADAKRYSQRMALLFNGLLFFTASLFWQKAEANNYWVTNNNDNVLSGSLRWAILQANQNPGPDNIIFGGNFTISVLSPLPEITESVTIDGNGNANVILDGGNRTFDGLVLRAHNCSVKGITLIHFNNAIQINHPTLASQFIENIDILGNVISDNNVGVRSQWAKKVKIQGNKIGVNPQGNAPYSTPLNQMYGLMLLHGTEAQVGGDINNITEKNVIASSSEYGVYIDSYHPCFPIKVQGNMVGADVSGSISLGNFKGGIYVSSPDKVIIGGPTPELGNCIPIANKSVLIHIDEAGIVNDPLNPATQGIIVQNNLVGLLADGVTAPNSGGCDGILVSSSHKVAILNNKIAVRSGWGVRLRDCGFAANQVGVTIQSNWFNSLDPTALASVPTISGMSGIYLETASHFTLIGGTQNGEGNIFSGLEQGVHIRELWGTNNHIRQNRFHNNVIPIHHPVNHTITSVTNTSVKGTGPVGAIIEIFYNSTANPGSPHWLYQGYYYLGSAVVDANGNWEFLGVIKPCETVVSTATLTGYTTGFAGKKVNEAQISFNDIYRPCGNQTNGALEIKITGGAQPYTYSWLEKNGSQWQSLGLPDTTRLASNLSEKPYAVALVSAEGCKDTAFYTLSCPCITGRQCWCSRQIQPMMLQQDPWECAGGGPTLYNRVSCQGGKTGYVCLNTDPLRYAWVNPPISYYWVYSNGTQYPAGTVLQHGGVCLNDELQVGFHHITVVVKDSRGWIGYIRGNFNIDSADICPTVNYTYRCKALDAQITGGLQGYTWKVEQFTNWSRDERRFWTSGEFDGNDFASISLPGFRQNVTAGVYKVTLAEPNDGNVVAQINIKAGIRTSAPQITRGCRGGNGQVCISVPHFSSVEGQSGYKVHATWSTGAQDSAIHLNFTSNPRFCRQFSPGSYSVRFLDSFGCDTTVQFTIPNYDFDLNAEKVDAECGKDNGKATAITNANLPSFQWYQVCANPHWNGCPKVMPMPALENLAPGSYYVWVRDRNGCTALDTVTIAGPRIRTTLETSSACLRNNGSLRITASGGTDTFAIASLVIKRGEERLQLPSANYPFINKTAVITQLAAGDSVWVEIQDSEGCRTLAQAFIPGGSLPVISISGTERTCRNDGVANVVLEGGNAPFTYLWSNGATTPNLRGIGPGSYTVTVTDRNGCSAAASITIESYEKPSVTFKFTDATCRHPFGSAYALAWGGVEPYTFSWCNGVIGQGNPEIQPGLCAVTVTDARGCRVTDTLVISDPNITLQLEVTQGTCGSSASIRANVSGGTGPYTYIWEDSPEFTSAERIRLRPGLYGVRVIDTYGCFATATAEIKVSPSLVAVTSLEQATCENPYANASVEVRGGTAPYTYLWSNGVSTARNENLLPGAYTVLVTDAMGCAQTATVEVQRVAPLSVNVINEPASCQKLGRAKAVATGGSGNYRYSWSCVFAMLDQSEVDGLYPGQCSVTVFDDGGCTTTQDFIIAEQNSIRLDLEATPITCELPGTVRARVETSAPYQISWSNNARGNAINVLTPGVYTAQVTDENGCTAEASVEVTGSGPPFVNINKVEPTCERLGRLEAQIRGGLEPYHLEWSNGATTSVISNLNPGSYTLKVTDSNGCVRQTYVALEGAAPLSLEVLTVAASCTTGGKARAIVTGGSGNYSYHWSCIRMGNNTAAVENLPSGSCSVTIRDNNGCEVVQEFVVPEAAPISIVLPAQTVIGCGSNNPIRAEVVGGTEPYQFLWSNGQSGAILQTQRAGVYTVTVTDNRGCQATATTSLRVITPPRLSVETRPAGCQQNGSAELSIREGQGPFTIQWSNGATGMRVNNLQPGSYAVTVTDANGCRQSVTATVERLQELTATVETEAATCLTPGRAAVFVKGGSGVYSYTWNCTRVSPPTSYHHELPEGECSVTIRDEGGCTLTQTFVILGPSRPEINFSITPIGCNTPGNIRADLSGGVAPYTYLWQGGANGNVLSNITTPGNYTLSVTDANGCNTQATATVTGSDALHLSVSTTSATCFSNGKAIVAVTGGAEPYAYHWSNGATTPENNNLSPGVYTLTVTDANRCSATATVQIGGGVSLEANLEIQNASCRENGSARVIATGGLAPYAYHWFCQGVTGSQSYMENIPPGYCFVQITDANGCSITRELFITVPEGPQVVLQRLDTPCESGPVTVRAIVEPGFGPFTYLWSNGSEQPVSTGLTPGTHSVTVTDNRGCKTTVSTTVGPKPAALQLNATSEPDQCDASGKARVIVSGGQFPYTYQWSNGAVTPQVSELSYGKYTVTVRDANGCEASQEVEVQSGSNNCCPYRFQSQVIPCTAKRFCMKFEAYRPVPRGVNRIELCVTYDNRFVEPTGNITTVGNTQALVTGYGDGVMNITLSAAQDQAIVGGSELFCIEFQQKAQLTPGSFMNFTSCMLRETYQNAPPQSACVSPGMVAISAVPEGCPGGTAREANGLSEMAISIYPNPTDNLLFLSFEVEYSGVVDIRIQDMNGRLVEKVERTFKEGSNLLDLDLSSYPAGFYFIQLFENENYSLGTKILKK